MAAWVGMFFSLELRRADKGRTGRSGRNEKIFSLCLFFFLSAVYV